MTAARPPALLSVSNLNVGFAGGVDALRDVSFTVEQGEAVALVGESGCGKSTIAHAIMSLLPAGARVSGTVALEGCNLLDLRERDLRRIRGKSIGMIFQEPMTALNPVHRIGDQIAEALLSHGFPSKGVRARVLELLDLVKLPDPLRKIDDYPHRLSGGQRQRVMLAAAIACQPVLLIADEPTTALDAAIRVEILELLDRLRRDLSMGILLISHDLAIVSQWTDRVVVMHHGRKMEEFAAKDIGHPRRHAYTRGLMEASIPSAADLHYTSRQLTEIETRPNGRGGFEFSLRHPDALDFGMADRPPRPASLLAVRNLAVDYTVGGRTFRAVDDVSFDIRAGETLGLVGESGSGKSSLLKALMRLVSVPSGSVEFKGQDLTGSSGAKLKSLRRDMQMVFQDPFSSLNPRQTVFDILGHVLKTHVRSDRRQREAMMRETLDRVGLTGGVLGRYPHEFSGGQRQRIAIARALIIRPALVICDEPVSSLDVSVQAQILNLLSELKHDFNLSYLFVSHDLNVVRYFSDRILVMKDGGIVEEGDPVTLWERPQHSYTRLLIDAGLPRQARPQAVGHRAGVAR